MPITKGFRALVDEAMAQVKTYTVEGGFTEWVKQGGPTETLEQRQARKPA